MPGRVEIAVFFLLHLAFGFQGAAYSEDVGSGDKKRAVVLFERGLKLLKEGKFEPALLEFEEAYAISPNPLVLFNMGVCFKETSRYVEASRTLKKFLAEAGEGVEKGFKEEAARMIADLESYIGYLGVECDPPGGELLVDGKSLGVLPMEEELPLDIGKHEVAIVKENHETFRKTIGIRSGEKLALKASLKKITSYGKLTVKAGASGAAIEVDGKSRGGPEWSGSLPEGRHDILVRAAGHRDFSCSANVERDEEKFVESYLVKEPPPSRLEVRINVQKADLLLDGKKRLAPPGVLWGISPGAHSIAIIKEGHRPVEGSIEVGPAQDILLAAELYPGKVSPAWFWGMLALSVGTLGGSLAAFLVTRDLYNDLQRGTHTVDERDEIKRKGERAKWSSIGLLAGGGASALATFTLYFFVEFKPKKSRLTMQFSNLPLERSDDCDEQSAMNRKMSGDLQ